MAKCKICGAAHKACGGPSSVLPVDIATREGNAMGGLKRYTTVVSGRRGGIETILQLSAEDAKARGLSDKDLYDKPKTTARAASTSGRGSNAKGRKAPANKQAAPAADKGGAPASAPAAPAAE